MGRNAGPTVFWIVAVQQGMNRRFLPSICNPEDRAGTYLTEWEGWGHTRLAISPRRHWYKTPMADVEKLEPVLGCYAILYRTSADNYYTAYIGYSANLYDRLNQHQEVRYEEDDIEHFWWTAVQLPSGDRARAFELDHIRYYAPPWNTKFYRQGHRAHPDLKF